MPSDKKQQFNWRKNKFTFTLNNPTDEELAQFEGLADNGHPLLKYLIAGSEIGDGTPENPDGTHHIQGYCELNINARQCNMSKWGLVLPGVDRMHLEDPKFSGEVNRNYCTKEEAWIEYGSASGKWQQIYETAKVDLEAAIAIDFEVGIKYHSQLQSIYNKAQAGIATHDLTLRPWQEKAWNLLETQGERQVLIVVDTKGNTGKSTFAKWILAKPRAWGCRGMYRITDVNRVPAAQPRAAALGFRLNT